MKKLLSVSLLIALLFASCGKDTLTSYVNPFVGTDGHGHTFPGAIVPFGMIQPSPDTRLEGWDGCSGYHYSDSLIYGFSHTHLSGTGCEDYCDLLLMPIEIPSAESEKVCSFGDNFRDAYKQTFSHRNEAAEAGYYRVMLDHSHTIVELTADERVAYHAYTFAGDQGTGFVVDLRHRDKLLSGKILLNNGMLVGWRESMQWAADQHLFFAIRSDVPFGSVILSEDSTQAVIFFEDGTKRAELQVAISGVDINGAIGNLLMAEHKTFRDARKAADRTWEKALGKIKVKGGSKEEKRVFYTALYHCMTAPYLWSDADGRYRGRDNRIHVADSGRQVYTVFSLWDTYRALHPLLTKIEPERTIDFVYTAMKNFEQGGELPMWELSANETHCMIGYHAAPMILTAMELADSNWNIAGYTPQQLLEAMVATSNRTSAHQAYARQAYLSSEVDNESVSKTLEYAYDDWCIAQMTAIANDTARYIEYMQRSNSWRNIMDCNGFMHPRRNGAFMTPFDPTEVNNNFTEANSWQYSTYVPHDVEGWVKRLGGEDKALQFLDSLFEGHNKMSGRDQSDITGLIGLYAHGNEPSHHAAYLYSLLGKPEKTKKYVHRILDELYTSKPDGLCGNEDCGQMSAWYVLSALGMYQVCPGNGVWTKTDMLFDDYESDFSLKGRLLPKIDIEVASGCVPLFNDWKMQIVGERSVEISGDSLMMNINGRGWKPYNGPIMVKDDCTIQARCGKDGPVVEQKLVRTPTDKNVTYLKEPAPQYAEDGPQAMVDRLHGTSNYRIGGWQGWTTDMEAIVELGKEQAVHSVGVDCLENMKSWIFFPIKILVEYSTDGTNWLPYGAIANTQFKPILSRQDESVTHTFTVEGNAKARFLKVTAVNFGALPKWHVSAGQQAWVFVDEIIIK